MSPFLVPSTPAASAVRARPRVIAIAIAALSFAMFLVASLWTAVYYLTPALGFGAP